MVEAGVKARRRGSVERDDKMSGGGRGHEKQRAHRRKGVRGGRKRRTKRERERGSYTVIQLRT